MYGIQKWWKAKEKGERIAAYFDCIWWWHYISFLKRKIYKKKKTSIYKCVWKQDKKICHCQEIYFQVAVKAIKKMLVKH